MPRENCDWYWSRKKILFTKQVVGVIFSFFFQPTATGLVINNNIIK